jgi:hypothetical protein
MKKKSVIVQSARVDITVFIQDDLQGTVFCMIAPKSVFMQDDPA